MVYEDVPLVLGPAAKLSFKKQIFLSFFSPRLAAWDQNLQHENWTVTRVTVSVTRVTVQRATAQKSERHFLFLGPQPAAQKNVVCAAGCGPRPYLGQFLSV